MRTSVVHLAKDVGTVVRVAVTLLVLAAATVLIVSETKGPLILVEPFDVPDTLSRAGWTSAALANRLVDHLLRIQTGAGGPSTSAITLSERPELPELVVPGAGLSLHQIVGVTRHLFGRRTTRLQGEIEKIGSHWLVTVRTDGEQAYSREEPVTRIDSGLALAARELMRRTQPAILASYYFNLGEYHGADSVAQSMLRTPPAEDDAAAYNLRGAALAALGRPEEALRMYRKALALSPHFMIARYNIALALDQLTDGDSSFADSSLATIESLLRDTASFAPAHVFWATLVSRSRHAASGWAWQRSSHCAYRERRQCAMRDLDVATRLDPTNGDAFSRRGDVFFNAKEYAMARVEYEEAQVRDPESYGPRLMLAEVDGKLRRFRPALDSLRGMYDEVRKRKHLEFSDSSWLAIIASVTGQVLFDSGATEAALAHYCQGTHLNPFYKEAYFGAGKALLKEKRLANAAYEFSKEQKLRDAARTDSSGMALRAIEAEWAKSSHRPRPRFPAECRQRSPVTRSHASQK